MSSYKIPVKKETAKNDNLQEKDFHTYSFVFRHKEAGFEDYEKDRIEIENRLNNQLTTLNKNSKIKTKFYLVGTSKFADDVKVDMKMNIDKAKAKKIADTLGWTLISK